MKTPQQIKDDIELARTAAKQGRMDYNDWLYLNKKLIDDHIDSVIFHSKTPTGQLCSAASMITETAKENDNDEP